MSNIFKNFDKVSLLTLSTRKDRLQHIEKMLEFYGLSIKDIDIHTTTPFPFNLLIINAFNNASNRRCFTKPNEYDCARNHYSIIKQALDEGVEHLLVIEDDICFIKNKETLEKYLNNLPEDYDIIQFGAFSNNPMIPSEILDRKDNDFYVKHPDILLWNASMYALSKKGMEYYIAFMDKWFTVADMPLYLAPKNSQIVNTYVSTVPLAIQADKDIMASDIRNKENDSIDYNHMNMYERYVDKSDYFEI